MTTLRLTIVIRVMYLSSTLLGRIRIRDDDNVVIKITQLYREIVDVVDVPLGLPVRQRRVVDSRGRVYAPHYNTYYYYYRTLFDDGLMIPELKKPVPRGNVFIYPPWKYSEIAERVALARQRIRYFYEEVQPRIERWLAEAEVRGYIMLYSSPTIIFHAMAMLSSLTFEDLVDIIDYYIKRNYYKFRDAEKYGVRTPPVEKIMSVFNLSFDEVTTTKPEKIARAIAEKIKSK